ncbi:hemolysin D [Desulfonema ishimotonii]|uniref:Hemolysin D n=1 Tax=Desulfonema ishimotonii TaxID=45657 RepID=A0A401FXJ3_9BACT|nr:site-2 protease family protein [Desulfonema ishimotonii]GBC61690.1 hemolysin D [Desulfonema ishimotonii]
MNTPEKVSTGGLQAIRSKADRMVEALEKGMKVPWKGLRPDLLLHKGAIGMDGKPTYVVEDPVRGAHFELGEVDVQLFLCLVTENDLKAVVGKLLRTTSLRPSVDDILDFLKMLQREKLAILPPELSINTAAIRESKQPTLLKKILKSYLFLKIPLLRPEGLLNAVYPWLSPLWSKPFLFLYAVLGVAGLIFVSQQIELYSHTVSHLFTPRGAFTFMICLSVLKTMHEFGHALAARHQGLYVRRMGMAFMVFMPIMYTDVTDAWKLPSRKGRMYIGAAGILVEICVAAISLFFWSVLPDGLLRSIMFYMSGASMVSTVLVNLNPLMRFDGYYILMDYLRISNLRTRSMEMFKYYRRRLLVDWQGPKPEEHPWEQGLVFFGLFTLIYRFMIFFSITLTIYHVVFKVLGVILVAMQIIMMLILPVAMEVFILLKSRKYLGNRWRVLASGTAFALIIGLLFAPLPTFEKLPAFFLFQDVAELKAPEQGRLVADLPEVGAPVQKGDLLLRLQDERAEQELQRVIYDLEQTEAILKNTVGGGVQGAYRKWLIAERRRLTVEAEKTRQGLSHLEIRSPISGRVLAINETLRKGSYVHKKGHLLTVGDDRGLEIRAYAYENIYRELRGKPVGEGRVFFRDLETGVLKGKFRELLDFPASEFPNDTLFDYAGGPILSNTTPRGGVRPRDAYYPIIFSVAEVPGYIRHGTPCAVRIVTDDTSIMEDAIRWVWRGLASEGFV